MNDKPAIIDPTIMVLMQLMGQGGGSNGLMVPNQGREFSTSDSRLTLWWNAKKTENMKIIEQNRTAAVTARTQALQNIMDLMYNIALHQERMYQERYMMEHQRKMAQLQEQLIEKQVTSVELENMIKKVRVETNIEELNIMKLENEIRRMELDRRKNDI